MAAFEDDEYSAVDWRERQIQQAQFPTPTLANYDDSPRRTQSYTAGKQVGFLTLVSSFSDFKFKYSGGKLIRWWYVRCTCGSAEFSAREIDIRRAGKRACCSFCVEARRSAPDARSISTVVDNRRAAREAEKEARRTAMLAARAERQERRAQAAADVLKRKAERAARQEAEEERKRLRREERKARREARREERIANSLHDRLHSDYVGQTFSSRLVPLAWIPNTGWICACLRCAGVEIVRFSSHLTWRAKAKTCRRCVTGEEAEKWIEKVNMAVGTVANSPSA